LRRLLLLFALIAAPSAVRADPVAFDYSASVNAGAIYANGSGAIDVSSSSSADGQSLTVSFGGSRLDLALTTGGGVATPGDATTFGPATPVALGTLTLTPAATTP
jgi:hypothetical protein